MTRIDSRFGARLALWALLVSAVPLFPAPAGETLRVGVCLSLSGEFASLGRSLLAGARARVDEINENGGIDGGMMELVVHDDKSDPAAVPGIVEEMAVGENLAVVIGSTTTNLSLAMRDAALKHEVVVVSPGTTSSRFIRNNPWMFRVMYDDEFSASALARFVANDLGIKRAGIIANRRFQYSTDFANYFRYAFEEEDGRIVVAEYWYNYSADRVEDRDFADVLGKMGERNPEIVVVPNYPEEVATMVRSAGGMNLDMAFCGGDTWLDDLVFVASGNKLQECCFIAPAFLDSDDPAMRRFVRLIDRSNDPDITAMSARGYDAATLVAEALREGTSSEDVRRGMKKIRNFPLTTGMTTITEEGDTKKPAFIYRVVKRENSFVPVLAATVEP